MIDKLYKIGFSIGIAGQVLAFIFLAFHKSETSLLFCIGSLIGLLIVFVAGIWEK